MARNQNGDDILFEEPFFRVNKFLAYYKTQELPILESAVGGTLIKPGYRKKMKEAFQEALTADLNDLLNVDLGEAVITADGIMIVAENDSEGYFTIQLDTKFKNLDYDPFDPVNAPKEKKTK
jgi:hypothetical protein